MSTIKEYFQAAEREKATDIYFSVGSPPFLKVNGGLRPFKPHPALKKATIERLAREVLSPEHLAEYESRLEVIAAHTIAGLGRLRIILSHERRGPSMVCRFIPLSIPKFDSLGLPSILPDLMSAGTGLILLMGCAGSGKTTTLASLTQHINNTWKKSILTMESPMEYVHPHDQSFIETIRPPKNGMLLEKNAYRGLLETADVMVMDGLPFEETISPALSAAAEGLLVLAALETNGGVAEVISRIINAVSASGKENRRHLLARTLRGALWQHLLPLKDGSGFTPAVEVLINDPAISSLMGKEGKLHLLRPTMAAGRYKGMQTMHQALETMKREGVVAEDTITGFAKEILKYYVSPINGRF